MKRKGHLAVFENILEESSAKDVDLDDDSSNMVTDEDSEKPKATKSARLSDESLILICKYAGCSEKFEDYFLYDKHLVGHIKGKDSGAKRNLTCKFGDCDFRLLNSLHAKQHMSCHGLHEKLSLLGDIVASRESLPDCTMENCFTCPSNVEIYSCEWEDCDMQMETYCDFLFHIKMHVNGNPSRVKVGRIKCCWHGCQKDFPSVHQLRRHVRSHTKEKYIACSTCGRGFSSIEKYSDHRNKQIPTEKQNYKCSQCSKLFAKENLLRNHVRGHINQYKCSMCDMTCPKPSALAVHIRYRHLNERLFKCNLCDHASISKQNLEMHLITHCVEKLLACDECDFQCRSMFGLDKHIRKEHGLNYSHTFECHLCKSEFTRGAYLTKHLMKTHGVQWPSGHSRFRYKEDPDGKYRLQTIRYETVDVIKEILKSKNSEPSPSPKKLRCRITKKNINGRMAVEAKVEEVQEEPENPSKDTIPKMNNRSGNVLLTISDVDEKGNIVSEFIESQEVIIKEELTIEDEHLLIAS